MLHNAQHDAVASVIITLGTASHYLCLISCSAFYTLVQRANTAIRIISEKSPSRSPDLRALKLVR